ncbi:FtsB family cell division protein [Blattabacterium cuenoti]|uniref:FtsB family cell division protein n=1 Tax=Blattabacterium cuenoti TaxID=1653831 RepID=UPI00163C3208|nr:septum formation initiator family protein [Blattabacterium cuenoti]
MKKKNILLKNKYFWISLSFIIWISFFDTNSLMLHWKLKNNIKKITIDRDFMKKKISSEENHLNKLIKNSKYLEKIAREKFHMKKENEDLFVIDNENKINIFEEDNKINRINGD